MLFDMFRHVKDFDMSEDALVMIVACVRKWAKRGRKKNLMRKIREEE